MQNGIKPPIRVVAEQLAKSNADAEPSVERIYLFPDEEEIRLVEIDTDFGSSEKVQPYYFGPQPIYGQPYPMAIALILPEEYKVIDLPEKWGKWEDAELIWSRAA